MSDLADVVTSDGRRLVYLASGAWDRTHGALRGTEWFDGGYRIAIAD